MDTEELTIKERRFLQEFLKTLSLKEAYMIICPGIEGQPAANGGYRTMKRIKRKLNTMEWQKKLEAFDLGEKRLLAEIDRNLREKDPRVRTTNVQLLAEILGKRRHVIEPGGKIDEFCEAFEKV